jgi:hypothetical protein
VFVCVCVGRWRREVSFNSEGSPWQRREGWFASSALARQHRLTCANGFSMGIADQSHARGDGITIKNDQNH